MKMSSEAWTTIPTRMPPASSNAFGKLSRPATDHSSLTCKFHISGVKMQAYITRSLRNLKLKEEKNNPYLKV